MFALTKNQGATFSRWLNLLLVVFILYGTTVEAAHRHGLIVPSYTGANAQLDNEHDKNLGNVKTGCNDCLICQLHQNLTTTLIALRLDDPPVRLPQRVVVAVSQDLLSQIITPVSGRAPPSIS
ncbi:MAG TPA: hypothetical protein VN844_09620 [Pyrinomonadaceae bacterium]|nr:hypothetical protein [Pyrinomonadaceae bacterium]